MAVHPWADAAWDAWRRQDVTAAARSAWDHTPEHGNDAVRLACYFAVRTQRADLLLDRRHDVEGLDAGLLRDSALLVLALADGDRRRATALAIGLRDAAPDVTGVADDDSDAAVRADMLVAVGTAAMVSGAWADGRQCVLEARAWLEESAVRGPHAFHAVSSRTRMEFDLMALDAMGEFHTHAGDEAQRTLSESVAPLRRHNRLTTEHTVALVALGHLEHVRGDLAAAALTLARALQLADTVQPGIAEHARIELAFIRVRQGRWRDADRLADLSGSPMRIIEAPWFPAQVEALRALMSVLRGDAAAAQRLIADPAVVSPRVPSYLASMLLIHTRLALALSRRDWTALTRIVDDIADPGYRTPYRDDEWHALLLAADWQRGRMHAVLDRHGHRARLPGADRDPYHLLFTALLADRDGDPDAAASAAGIALPLLGPDLDPAGRALARSILTGLRPAVPRARRPDPHPEPTTPSRPQPRPQPQPTPVALTAQQHRIATAVAQGYTSAEIAEMMHLTKRTIDYHVQNIVRRLGLTSRREIARRLLDPHYPQR